MLRSEKRILTTHAGSLPRPKALNEMFVKKSRREPLDASALEAEIEAATREAECGIDVGNDGEQPRESFFTYVQHRMSGFGGESQRPVMRDITHYPSFLGLPRERIRMHVCWGNYEGPHVFDVPLEDILPRLYAARVGALVLSMANPRHAHEHRALRKHPLPAGMLLVAGVIDTTTNYVEHPQVVADRLELAAGAVGDPRRVLAGTDCGFGTAAGLGEVATEVVWEKLARSEPAPISPHGGSSLETRSAPCRRLAGTGP